jgi:hypothetical protein
MKYHICTKAVVISISGIFFRMRGRWIILYLQSNTLYEKDCLLHKYRVIHKSLRDFRPLRYSSRDGHAEGEHVNRGRDTPKFLSYLTGARYVHPWWRDGCQILANSKTQTAYLFPVHAMFRHDCPPSGETCKYATAPSTKKKNLEIFSVCWYAPWSWLLRSRVRKSRRDCWIILYIVCWKFSIRSVLQFVWLNAV